MIKVYLSGPINSIGDAEENKQRFTDLKLWLRCNYGNWDVVNPCEVGTKCVTKDCGEFDGHSWNCWLKTDLRAMLKCDAICLLPDARLSAGARLEQLVARAVGMTVYTAVQAEMKGWVIKYD